VTFPDTSGSCQLFAGPPDDCLADECGIVDMGGCACQTGAVPVVASEHQSLCAIDTAAMRPCAG
jgi:hypothetical protein